MKGRMKPMFRGSLQRKLLGVMLVTAFVTVLVALGAMIGHDLRTAAGSRRSQRRPSCWDAPPRPPSASTTRPWRRRT
jgi:hypothetical protein